MKASEIPNDAIVHKVNGTKEYIIRDKFIVYYDKKIEKERDIIALDGAKILISKSGRGNINVIPGDTELVWKASLEDINNYLTEEGVKG